MHAHSLQLQSISHHTASSTPLRVRYQQSARSSTLHSNVRPCLHVKCAVPARAFMKTTTEGSDCCRVQKLTDAAVAAAEAEGFREAAALFAAALELCPSDAALHEQHAQCLMELEEYEAAVKAAETATTLQPNWPDGWVTLGRSYFNTGQLQSAQQAFSKSLALNPEQLDVQHELAEAAHLAQQQLARRIGLHSLTINADPAGQLGPGCVVWEAGIQLAQLLVRSQQQQHLQHDQTRHNTAQPLPGAASMPTAFNRAVSNQHMPWHPLAGAHVLEVGSGTGICGITAAALGANVTLTDLPGVQPLLTANIAANQRLVAAGGGSATAAVLDWQCIRKPEQCSSLSYSNNEGSNVSQDSRDMGSAVLTDRNWDWAMGADLVYNAGQVQVVAQLIATLLQPGSRSINAGLPSDACTAATVASCSDICTAPAGFLLAHKCRHQEVDQQLLEALQHSGLHVRQLHHQQQLCCQSDDSSANMSTSVRQADGCVSIWWITVERKCSGMLQENSTTADDELAAQQCKQRPPEQAQLQQQLSPAINANANVVALAITRYVTEDSSPELQRLHQQLQLRQPGKKLLLLSAGLAGVGKSTILRQLHATLGHASVYIDKDTVTAALLGAEPYFSEYYKQHVQQQTYAVMLGIAADNLAAKAECVVILDGQFGDRLSAAYIWPYVQAIRMGDPLQFGQQVDAGNAASAACEGKSHWQQEQPIMKHLDQDIQQQQMWRQQGSADCAVQLEKVPAMQSADQQKRSCCRVVLIVFDTGGDGNLQLQRLQSRGSARDMSKYASFDQYRVHELQLLQRELAKVHTQLDGIVRVDTSKTVAECVDSITEGLGLAQQCSRRH